MKVSYLRLVAAAAIALAAGTASARPTTIAVYGDAPYGTRPGDTAELNATPAFIDAVNNDRDVSLVLHVGDIHSGKEYCTEAYDRSIFDLWSEYQAPLVYTPGDNEWTDCNKSGEGGNVIDPATGKFVDFANGNPIDNLALIRSIFFPRPGFSLGQNPIHVTSQGKDLDHDHPGDQAFVENVIWQMGDVLFVTLNVPGGSNDDTDVWYGAGPLTSPQVAEKAARDQANLRWLAKAFEMATTQNAEAIVIGLQADMWDPEKGAAHQQAYEPLIGALANLSLEFGKPVLMFNGDSHVYQTGNPFDPADPRYSMHPFYNVPNFHRVVVHGSTFPLEYTRLTITPGDNNPNGGNAFGPFSWTRVIP